MVKVVKLAWALIAALPMISDPVRAADETRVSIEQAVRAQEPSTRISLLEAARLKPGEAPSCIGPPVPIGVKVLPKPSPMEVVSAYLTANSPPARFVQYLKEELAYQPPRVLPNETKEQYLKRSTSFDPHHAIQSNARLQKRVDSLPAAALTSIYQAGNERQLALLIAHAEARAKADELLKRWRQ